MSTENQNHFHNDPDARLNGTIGIPRDKDGKRLSMKHDNPLPSADFFQAQPKRVEEGRYDHAQSHDDAMGY